MASSAGHTLPTDPSMTAASSKRGISLKITSSDRPSLTTYSSPVVLALEHLLSEFLVHLLIVYYLSTSLESGR